MIDFKTSSHCARLVKLKFTEKLVKQQQCFQVEVVLLSGALCAAQLLAVLAQVACSLCTGKVRVFKDARLLVAGGRLRERA